MNDHKIPDKLNIGSSHNSSMLFIMTNFIDYNELNLSNELLMTDKADSYACGFPVPPFQRRLYWNEKQEIAFIESAWLGLPLGSFCIHGFDWLKNGEAKKFSGWLIDGQQRLNTIQRYLEGKFKVFDVFYSELNKQEKIRFKMIGFPHSEIFLWDENKIKSLYNRLAFGGTAHKISERAVVYKMDGTI